MNRREFIQQGTRAALAASAWSPLLSRGARPAGGAGLLRVAAVGTGIRGTYMWALPLSRDYRGVLEYVGLCDINPLRAAHVQGLIGAHVPTFTDFDEMIRTARPDLVIVTTVDAFHAHYVVRAMELGCDVLCEKPLCTEAEQAQAIIDAARRTGRNLNVTFNARYIASAQRVKEILLSGEMGEIYSVDYAEFLDLSHGADYFRRWHAFRQNSGTLFCHKASHHFDQLNWWLNAEPVEVSALGRLNKYGRNGPFRHSHCRPCEYKDRCPLYFDITKDPLLMQLYVATEAADGYYRDACLYRSSIDIYDTMSAQIRYDNHAIVTYSLNATEPYEGQRIVFNGSRGRMEVRNFDSQPWKVPNAAEIRLTRNGRDSVVIPVPFEPGEHGGADGRIRDMLFRPGMKDPLGQRAGLRAGILSSAIGIAAYTSIDRSGPVKIADLVRLS